MSGEGKMGGTVFGKSQAPSRIPLMISVSKAGAVSLKAVGTAGQIRRSQRDQAFHSVTCLQSAPHFSKEVQFGSIVARLPEALLLAYNILNISEIQVLFIDSIKGTIATF